MPGLNIDLEVSGLDELADIFQNAPEAVAREAEQAGRESVGLLADAIADETPVDTGFLKRSEGVSLESVFNIVFTASAPYAVYVNADNPFIERGQLRAIPGVNDAYDRALDRLAGVFAHGGIR